MSRVVAHGSTWICPGCWHARLEGMTPRKLWARRYQAVLWLLVVSAVLQQVHDALVSGHLWRLASVTLFSFTLYRFGRRCAPKL